MKDAMRCRPGQIPTLPGNRNYSSSVIPNLDALNDQLAIFFKCHFLHFTPALNWWPKSGIVTSPDHLNGVSDDPC